MKYICTIRKTGALDLFLIADETKMPDLLFSGKSYFTQAYYTKFIKRRLATLLRSTTNTPVSPDDVNFYRESTHAVSLRQLTKLYRTY